ncbi:alanine racemase [Fulvivirgaceae bacterium BMA12]|uniref:Alanine racemase n=1 Tax=Agaribacillus aureus TaxID=3051825 RepID=A0ABT8LI27_9BACT|nr:alanine racemase [Fulvivirgaceae bacterium BMA12]
MLTFDEKKITSPTLVVDQRVCQRNIRNMLKRARDHQVNLRPHFKTHQSALVGGWHKALGITSITVSSLNMALYFAKHGWKDITVAFPLNIREMHKVNQLASGIKLNVLIESMEQLEALESALKFPVGLFMKIDAGSHRTGVAAENVALIGALINKIKSMDKARFKGFLTHAGHSYKATSKAEVLTVHQETTAKMVNLKSHFSAVAPDIIVSLGDTPTASLADSFENVDEIRPGNFVYYDVMQKNIGSCQWEDIAVAVACPIVAKHETRNEIVVYGGAVHFSKDSLTDNDHRQYFGLVVPMGPEGWGAPLPGCYMASLSQEHGVVKMDPAHFGKFHIGDLLYILPIHSCLTVDVIPDMITLEGEVVDNMKTSGANIYSDKTQVAD